MKRKFLSAFLGLLAGMIPLVYFRLYENYGLIGGVNEVFEGFLLYVLAFIPMAIILVFIVKVLQKTNIEITNKVLFAISLVISACFFYLF